MTTTATPWARICGWGDANGAYLITPYPTWVGAYPSGASGSTTILPVLAAVPTIPASRLEALSPVGGDSTLSVDLVLRASLASTLGQLWRVTQPVARAVEYIGATETSIAVDDDASVTAAGAVGWINGEAVIVSSKAGDVLTVTRGALSTYARRHGARTVGDTTIGAAVYSSFPGPAGMILEMGRGADVYWRGVVDGVSVQGSHTVTIAATSILTMLRGKLYAPQQSNRVTRGNLEYIDDRLTGTVHDLNWRNSLGNRIEAIESSIIGGKLGCSFLANDGAPGDPQIIYVIGENEEWIAVSAEFKDTIVAGGSSLLVYEWTLAQTQDVLACGIGGVITPIEGAMLVRHAARVVSTATRCEAAATFTGNKQIEDVLERILGMASDGDASPMATGGIPAAYIDFTPTSYRGTGVVLPSNAGFYWLFPPTFGGGFNLLDWVRENLLIPLGLGITHDFGKVRLVDWLARDADLAVALERVELAGYSWQQSQTRALPVLAVKTTTAVTTETSTGRHREGFFGVLHLRVAGRSTVRQTVTTNDVRVYVSAAAGVDALNGPTEFADGGWLMAGRVLDWYDGRAEGLVDTWGLSRPTLTITIKGPVDTGVLVGSIVTLNTADALTMPDADGTLSLRSGDAPLVVIARQHAQLSDSITLTCVQLQGNATLARWEPSAKVVSFNAGTGVVTVEANEFTSATVSPTSDAAAFVRIIVSELRLMDSTGAQLDTCTLDAVGTNTLTISGYSVAPSAGNFLVVRDTDTAGPATLWYSSATPKRYA